MKRENVEYTCDGCGERVEGAPTQVTQIQLSHLPTEAVPLVLRQPLHYCSFCWGMANEFIRRVNALEFPAVRSGYHRLVQGRFVCVMCGRPDDDSCCGGACETKSDDNGEIDELRMFVDRPQMDDEPTFTVPLELLESKSFDAVRID